ERHARPLALRRERVEVRARLRGEDAERPERGRGRVAAELAQVDGPPHGEVVVPAQADRGPRLDRRAALVRVRPVADEVAEAPELVRRVGVDRRQYRLESGEIPVDVGDDGDAHGDNATNWRGAQPAAGLGHAA